ncbi:putative potassium channel [Diaporthe ampelina]|uniref:Putative potassium channel n=1 Tax=Diaporthe ampelina TaxID=1214573 RepID=A0A0G2HKM3_9PEZI|nr:putative potassium channel [Diaporthe ampelina]
MMADSGDRVEDHVEAFDSQEPQATKEDKPQQSPGGDPIHNDEAHLDPSRWWFASSAFPLIAGTLGPVANAFSICALVRPWRQKFPPGSDLDKAQFVTDPVWLTVINAIQVVMAVIANLVLLLNMARKIRFSIAQPITIVTWYISSICLVALNATAAGPLVEQPEDIYIWSQAFYYGIYAACLYFVCSSLMVVTFWGAMKGHYSKDFQLTNSQRTLMLQTIMFLVYLLVGALVFSTIEGWPYLDAVYWADVTLFTVGFGDFSAATPLGRAFLFPYALIGVISLGLVVGSIRSLVLERGQRQLSARLMEKKRKTTLKRMVRRGKDDILVPVTDEGDYDDDYPERSTASLTEYQRRKREFELMRKIQQCELRYQGWTYFDGFYFAFVSLTTIGYGDVTPISPAGKSFFVFWSLLALPTMTVLISNAGDTVVKFVREATDKLGTVTILPDEKGFKKTLKEMIRPLSLGQVFGDDSDVEESPPGGLGYAEEHDGDSDEHEGASDESTKSLDREVENVTGTGLRELPVSNDGTQTLTDGKDGRNTGGKQGPLAGGTPTEDTDQSTHKIRRSSTTPVSAPTSKGHLSFKEPPGRPSSSKNGSVGIERSTTVNSKGRGANSDQNDIRSQTLKMSRAVSMPRTSAEIPRDVPMDPHDYHLLLIDEISRVTQHLKSRPPRKYDFHEWAWFLKLVGEDESSAETHKKAIPKSKKKGKGHDRDQGAGGGMSDEPEKLQWSWVGSRSPLMGSQEEAEWILEKLEQKLAGELRAVRDAARKMASDG